MTHDQLQSIAVQCMHQITERLHILDMYAEPTASEVDEFMLAIREKVKVFNEACAAYASPDN